MDSILGGWPRRVILWRSVSKPPVGTSVKTLRHDPFKRQNSRMDGLSVSKKIPYNRSWLWPGKSCFVDWLLMWIVFQDFRGNHHAMDVWWRENLFFPPQQLIQSAEAKSKSLSTPHSLRKSWSSGDNVSICGVLRLLLLHTTLHVYVILSHQNM